MTYVKRRGMVLLVDDSKVPKYTGEGFKVYTPPAKKADPKAGAKNGSAGK